MRLTRFWRTLEELNGAATSQREWVEILGEEFAPAAVHFRPSGQRAEALVCPRASENGCMREVVKLIDGRLRAECGDMPRRCDHVDLEKDDVAILEVDHRKLAKAIGRALKLSDPPTSMPRTGASLIGRYEISVGRGFPVFMYLPQPALGLDPGDLDVVIAPPPGPRLLLVPTRRSASMRVLAGLDRHQTTTMVLDDVLVWDKRRGLVAIDEPKVLFVDLLGAIAGAAATKAPAMALPPGTTWSSISIDFENVELVTVRGPGVQRAVSPGDLEMASMRNGRVREPWKWLMRFALHGGRMPIGDSAAQKRKQFVSEKLSDFLGLPDDPIIADGGNYVARFTLRGDNLLQGRADQRERNFVHDD